MRLHIELLSDATFGRGDGVAGLLDQEITFDPLTGLPFLRGRVLKGLLVEECANILFGVQAFASEDIHTDLEREAAFLFGQPGSTLEDDALMRIGTAQLPDALRQAIVQDSSWTPNDVLETLTAIRRQTAVDETTGAPDKGSLRTMRVLLRETKLTAKLRFEREPSATATALLAACVAGLRRAGTGRNRGRGRLLAYLNDEETQRKQLAKFGALVRGEVA